MDMQNGGNGKTIQEEAISVTVEKIKKHIREKEVERLSEIDHEFKQGFDFMDKIDQSVTIYGSARAKETDPYYIKARSLAFRIAKELRYAVTTGGGPGIMEAANRGAKEAGGHSIGFNIRLPREQTNNPYITDTLGFNFFFIRRVMMAFSAEAYIFFPGGFGTLDEFFEILTLVQTHKIPHVPMILVGKEFWAPLHDCLRERLLESYKMIGPYDNELYKIIDNEDEIIDIIRNAPPRHE